jgi:L-lactate dehydrogenase (cytochrome)
MGNAKSEGQTLFWQIYAVTDLSFTERGVRRVGELGCREFALAADAVRMGKERDSRLDVEERRRSYQTMKKRNLKAVSAEAGD